MSDTPSGPESKGFLAETVEGIRNNLEVFFLVALLWTVASLFVSMMMLDDMAAVRAAGQDDPEAMMQAIRDFLPSLFGVVVIGAVLFSAVAVLWARVVAVGRGRAFEGGFLHRFLRALWRTVSMFGYLILIMIALALVGLLFSVVGSLIGGNAVGITSVLLLLLAIGAFLPVYLAYLVSVVAAALDGNLPIMAAIKALSGHWRPYVMIALVTWLISIAISLLTSPAISPDAAEPQPSILQMLPGMIVGALAGLFLISASVVTFRRIMAGREDRGSIGGGIA